MVVDKGHKGQKLLFKYKCNMFSAWNSKGLSLHSLFHHSRQLYWGLILPSSPVQIISRPEVMNNLRGGHFDWQVNAAGFLPQLLSRSISLANFLISLELGRVRLCQDPEPPPLRWALQENCGCDVTGGGGCRRGRCKFMPSPCSEPVTSSSGLY